MGKISDITAAILVGGKGTRLQSVVSDRPKALAEISGKPFLSYTFDQLINSGINRVVLCTGYMADKIETCFGDTYKSLDIQYSKEDEPLGTGGGLRLALPHLTSDTILVMNGDSYIDADLDAYINWFFKKERQVSLLLTEMDDTSRYGKVIINSNKEIAAFEEKSYNAGPGWINAGVYLIKKALISSIPTGKFYSLERDLFPSLTEEQNFGYCDTARFIDIGTPESYSKAEDFFNEKQ
ncbi:MAG: nucleotidyltransferase family protein [Sedimentisphaerales bacterium]|nr:nucleotidyltransferase family protein [Sedimentisphaerales bacterium]